MARGIHCWANLIFISFARPASLYCEEYVCVCVCVCVYVHIYIIKLRVKHFLNKSDAVRIVDWIFIIGAPDWRWLGEYVTLDKTFHNILFEQNVAFLKEAFIKNIVILLCTNYII